MAFDSQSVAQSIVSALQNTAGVSIDDPGQATDNLEIVVDEIWKELRDNVDVQGPSPGFNGGSNRIAVEVDPSTGVGTTTEDGGLS